MKKKLQKESFFKQTNKQTNNGWKKWTKKVFFLSFSHYFLNSFFVVRERRKKGESNTNSENQSIQNEEGRSASKGRERSSRNEDPRGSGSGGGGGTSEERSAGVRSSRDSNGRSVKEDSQNSNQVRPSSNQRVSREEIPIRPSSSQRRNDPLNESKERVVRDTVSFSRSDPPISRQSPTPIITQPTYNPKPKGNFFRKNFSVEISVDCFLS